MQSPKNSTRKLSQQAHVSRTTCWRVLIKQSRSQALSCNGCATITRGRPFETSKLLHVASDYHLGGPVDPFQYIMSVEVSSLRPCKFAEHVVLDGGERTVIAWTASPWSKNRCLVWCVRDAHHWTDIFWPDSQHGSLHEHFWRILCSTNSKRDRAFSSSRRGRHATLLGCPCSEFATSSLRNERLAKICGRHTLLPLQHATIFSGDTWKERYTNQISRRYRNWRTSATQL